ncbi:type I 3-dehydroquinase-domain-containing protein [Dactylonectria macrodidyma]|uniref:Type I 3-dehydroquinase-domain-containing protein n=1 Tax=Dactylonectria macrodidyma TaxID=307937 RepID=A0A9P9IWZ2_9HYPO|nr:type I 3-dehydroquinase-domain-containing protein [Dactylonectria macrodidyma]
MAGLKRPLEAVLVNEDAPTFARDGGSSFGAVQIHSVTMTGPMLTDPASAARVASAPSTDPSSTFPSSTDPRPGSQDAVNSAHSPPFPLLTAEPLPEFRPDASMVLVGIRGAGKSTLAIMASSATNRKVIDLETAFQSALGTTSTDYKAKHGSVKCHAQQARVLEMLLHRHSTGCVLVCSWISSSIQALLRAFSAAHPVIHIVRDADAIEKLFKIRDKSKMWDLLRVGSAIFRTCTNFEFFNASEKAAMSQEPSSKTSPMQRASTPCLALKHTERHFLKFLSLIFPAGSLSFIEPALPLAKIAIEERRFTYATTIPLSDVLEARIDMEKHVSGADAIQITVDGLEKYLKAHSREMTRGDLSVRLADDITRGIGKTRRDTTLPIILDIPISDVGDEDLVQLYLDLVHHATRLAPEMITVDLRLSEHHISQVVVERKRTKVIGACIVETDPPPWDSPIWMSWYEKATTLGCHLARLIRPALTVDDNFDVGLLQSTVAAIQGPKIPLTAYNSGLLGRTSASFNRILTAVSPDSFKSVSDMTALSPTPSLTALEATKALFSCFMFEPLKYFVFGAHVDYSMSSAMHKSGFQACGISHDHQPYSSSSLRGFQHLLEDPLFGGASVGLPFKIEVISLTHSLSIHAQAIGAVNTLIPVRHLNPDGSIPTGANFFLTANRSGPIKAIYGENTDWVGIQACIRRGLSPANAITSNTCGLIIGAGGMARATIYAMLQLGIRNLVIYNRTPENAEKVISHFTRLAQQEDSKSPNSNAPRFHVIRSLDDLWPTDYRLPTVIISCIPNHRIGDTPAPDFTLPNEWLGSATGGIVIDIGYKSLNTPLLVQVRNQASRGWVTMDGLDILPEQGFAQFELFTGRRAPRRVMRRAVLQSYQATDGNFNTKE